MAHPHEVLRPVFKRLDGALSIKGGVSNNGVLCSYIGRLVQGRSDFEALHNHRSDTAFKRTLGLGLLPSSPTLRQRMDANASALFDFVPAPIETLLLTPRADYGVRFGALPLDIDTSAMGNSATAKEAVDRTYASVDGYCPLAADLGRHGFCSELALRPSVQHSAGETGLNIERVVPMAQSLSAQGAKAPILARLDSGFDSAQLKHDIDACYTPGLPQLDWLINWNPRKTNARAIWTQLTQELTTD